MVEAEKRRHARFVEIVALQSAFLLFFSLVLDGGVLLTAYTISLAAYWISVAVLSIRVRGRYKPRDLIYINRAWLVIVPVGTISVLFIRAWAFAP